MATIHLAHVATLPITSGLAAPLRRRRAEASAFFWASEPHPAVPSSPFAAEAVAQGSVPEDRPKSDEPASACFHRGKVCNKEELPEDPLKTALRGRQSRLLKAAMQHGFCSDPSFSSREACDAASGRWQEQDGPFLKERVANAAARARDRADVVVREAANYDTAYEDFHRAYEAYAKEARVWQDSIKQVEDDYLMWCRPFHDVSMKCESNFRTAMRWWFGREPLPSCEVGVVTPYLRNKTKGFATGFLLA